MGIITISQIHGSFADSRVRVLSPQPGSRSLASAQLGNRHAQSGARIWCCWDCSIGQIGSLLAGEPGFRRNRFSQRRAHEILCQRAFATSRRSVTARPPKNGPAAASIRPWRRSSLPSGMEWDDYLRQQAATYRQLAEKAEDAISPPKRLSSLALLLIGHTSLWQFWHLPRERS